MLTSNIRGFEMIRHPANYANYYSDDDYHKLRYLFGDSPRIINTHPLLGWVKSIDPKTYTHNDTINLQGRRPVLLYGDSFAGCASSVLCFEDILNSDPVFAQDYYLLNYGVGSYGLDQIYLLFQQSYHLYEDPFVVVSLMTLDLDRSILTVRFGQKPYFELKDGELQLQGVPIYPDAQTFFEANPPKIKSYVYRSLLYNYFPPEVSEFMMGEADKTERKKNVNEKLILSFIKELRAHNIDFVFLVFHPHVPGVTHLDEEIDWRDPFLRELFVTNEVPYIWSKELVQSDLDGAPLVLENYLLPGDGHPTEHFNRLIAAEIKREVLANSDTVSLSNFD